jgi:hypothetical protein
MDGVYVVFYPLCLFFFLDLKMGRSIVAARSLSLASLFLVMASLMVFVVGAVREWVRWDGERKKGGEGGKR